MSVRQRQLAALKARFLTVSLDPLRIALFMLMVMTVSRIHQHFRLIAKLRPGMLLVFAVGAYALMNPKFIRTETLVKSWLPKVIFALAIQACLSVPFGVSIGNSGLFIITDYSKTIIFAVLLMVAVRNTRDLFTVVWAYVVASGFLVWQSWFVFKVSKSHGSAEERLGHMYGFDANDVGLVLLVGLALTLLTLQTSSKRGKIASAVILGGIGATIARTGSRGAFLGLVVVGAVVLFTLKGVDVTKRIGFVVVTVVALILGAPKGYWDQMRTLLEPTSDYNWQTREGRKQVAKRGMGYMMDYPIFGVGIDNFRKMECILGDKALNNAPGTGLRCTPPHNSYVEAGAELGIPGLFLFCGLVFGGIISMYRLRRRLPPQWAKGDPEERFLYLSTLYFGLAMVAFAITCTFLTFAWLEMLYIIAAYMAGLYVCVEDKLRRSGGLPATRPRRGQRPVRAGPVRPAPGVIAAPE
jgi:O-antigen ligase